MGRTISLRSGRRRSELRQREREGAAGSRSAVDGESAAVQLHKSARQGKSETGSLLRCGPTGLLELEKDSRLVLRCDPDAVIAHAECDLMALISCENLDVPAPLGEIQRIRQEVENHLLEQAFVGLDDVDARVHFKA